MVLKRERGGGGGGGGESFLVCFRSGAAPSSLQRRAGLTRISRLSISSARGKGKRNSADNCGADAVCHLIPHRAQRECARQLTMLTSDTMSMLAMSMLMPTSTGAPMENMTAEY